MTSPRNLVCVLVIWLAVTAATVALPYARAASNVVPPTQISDTTQPSTAP